MAKTKIEWTANYDEEGNYLSPGYTFNPWWGCVKVSEGCKNCYAEKQANRFGDWWGPTAERRFLSETYWKQPIKWNRDAEAAGERRKVFCGSMCDVFEDREDLRYRRRDLYRLIYDTPHLDWLLLTKRPENIEKYYHALPWPNVWLGTSVENQEQADRRIPELLKNNASIHFLSMEPLLGPVDIEPFVGVVTKEAYPDYDPPFGHLWKYVDWVIVGGESGPGARPMHPEWARSIRDQCQDAGVPFFFKQWGAWYPDKKRIFEGVETAIFGETAIHKLGKKKAGRLLDGREWNEYPQV